MPPQGNETNTTSTDESAPRTQGGQGAKKKSSSKKAQGQGKSQGPKSQGKGQKAAKPPKEPKPKKEKPQRAVPAHLAKVDKVAAQLPALSNDAQVIVSGVQHMATADIYAVIAHLQIAVRRRGITQIAQGQARGDGKLAVGDRVTVLSSQNPRFIGMSGTVDKVQRIRCYVKLDGKTYTQKAGRATGDYFFHSDVQKAGGAVAATGGDLAETLQRLTRPAQGVDIMTLADENAAEEPTGS